MNTPISWLKAYVPDLPVDIKGNNGAVKDEIVESNEAQLKDFVDRITLSGSHVEESVLKNKNIRNVVVGKILEIKPHPDADKLVICQVDIGKDEPIQIVTGASNVKEGDRVPTVLDGGRVPCEHTKDGTKPVEGGNKIKAGKLRGVESFGMMCSIEELGQSRDCYPEAPLDGVYVFPETADVKPGDDAAEVLGLCDAVVEYEITSNRVDCFSMIGMAREAAATYKLDFKEPVIEVKGNGGNVNDYASVEVKDTQLCRRYCARVVTDLKLAPSPKWMQDRLRAQGIRPINNLVDITNYVMEEYGQPMHAFDLDTVAGHKIVVRRAENGDKFVTLDGQERELDNDVLMICDAEKEIGIAGIMGGENSMVTDNIKTLLFEAACFDGTNIRLSSRRLNLATDAAAKFVKGLDPNLALTAINRACQLIEELDCGKVVDGVIDIYPEPVSEKVLKFEPEKMNALLGLEVSEADMLEIFNRLELKYNEADRTLTIPTFRQDLNCMADLAEEVARFYGYDKIPSTLTTVNAGIGGIPYNQQIEGIARDVAQANGFSQAYCYSFESPKVFDKLLLPEDDVLRDAVKISNPLGEDFSIMRTVSLNGLLNSLSINYNRRNKNVRLYELGKVYLPKELPLKELPEEKMRLTLGMYGQGDFFRLKGVVDELFAKTGITGADYVPVQTMPFLHPGRQAEIVKGNLKLGYIGQLHPLAAENYDIKTDVYVAVINMDVVTMVSSFDIKYTSIAKFPAVTRDLSVVCDKSVYVGDIEKTISKAGGKLLEKLELFDVYEGEQVGEGKKSVAFALSFRAIDHTLKDDEINPVVAKVLKKLSELGIEIRS